MIEKNMFSFSREKEREKGLMDEFFG